MCKFPGTLQDTILATCDLKSTVNNFQILRISHLKILIDECKNELLLGILRNYFLSSFSSLLQKQILNLWNCFFFPLQKKLKRNFFLSLSLSSFLPHFLHPTLSLSLSLFLHPSLTLSRKKLKGVEFFYLRTLIGRFDHGSLNLTIRENQFGPPDFSIHVFLYILSFHLIFQWLSVCPSHDCPSL